MDIFENQSTFLIILVGILISLLILGFISAYFFRFRKRETQISNRLENLTSFQIKTSDVRETSNIVSHELSGSLFSRTVIIWFRQLLAFLGRFTPANRLIELEQKLTIAGDPGGLHAREFFALRLLSMLIGIFLAYLLNRDLGQISLTSLLYGFLILYTFFSFPEVWLRGKIRSRQAEISRGLPDILDMLSVCASAGLGFDQSLQKICEYWDTELGRELRRVISEMEVGTSRSEALKNMSKRLDVDELTQFVAIITQAEKIGMSYAEVLQSQAIQLRILRQYRAREIANRLPGKMIFPLAITIFPAIIIVILAPLIPVIMGAL